MLTAATLSALRQSLVAMPIAVIPITMMPIMARVALVPRIVLIFLMSMLPGVVVESQSHARQFNASVGMPAFILVAGDIRGGSRGSGGYEPETDCGRKNAPHHGFCTGCHNQSPFLVVILSYA